MISYTHISESISTNYNFLARRPGAYTATKVVRNRYKVNPVAVSVDGEKGESDGEVGEPSEENEVDKRSVQTDVDTENIQISLVLN